MKNIISIVTPSYNQGQFIESTIRSILSQEGDFYIDYVIVDGASTDDSVKIIRKYEDLLKDNCRMEKISGHNFYVSSSPNFEFNKCLGINYRWLSEKDSGHGDALNKGFAMTFGEIMAWLNSDDMYHSKAFSKVSNLFESFKDVQWIVGKNTWWDKYGKMVDEAMIFKNFYDFIFGDYTWIQQESTFWSRCLWNKAGAKIDTNIRYMVDGELWSRFLRYEKLYHIDQKLGGYRMHDTNRAKLNYDAIIDEMDKFVSEMKNNLPSTNYSLISGDSGKWMRKEIPYKEKIKDLIKDEIEDNIKKEESNKIKKTLEYRLGLAILFVPKIIKNRLIKLLK